MIKMIEEAFLLIYVMLDCIVRILQEEQIGQGN